VLPSYREGTPRTNLEAMATGRAIITTDVPGCRETVEHGVNGLLVPAADAHALAAAMLELLRDPARIRRMADLGLERCRARYELDAVTRSIADIIEATPSGVTGAQPTGDGSSRDRIRQAEPDTSAKLRPRSAH
jgi:glycosyltransferase involved in cell wall biosynthesis